MMGSGVRVPSAAPLCPYKHLNLKGIWVLSLIQSPFASTLCFVVCWIFQRSEYFVEIEAVATKPLL